MGNFYVGVVEDDPAALKHDSLIWRQRGATATVRPPTALSLNFRFES